MTSTVAPGVTIVVSPRDAFSQTRGCLSRLLECTPPPRQIIVVDGGSPPETAEYLAGAAVEYDLALIRSEHLLTPNQSRNLGIALVSSGEWIALVDNDAYVEPEWLERLIRCGDDTGAAAVTPLHCVGRLGTSRVHVAGGDASVVDSDGTRRLREVHPFANELLAAVGGGTERRECGMFEFHAVLVRRRALTAVGRLDERLWSLLEHTDLSLALREQGGTIWFEPTVAVTYIPTSPLRGADREFFVTRWSDDWNLRSAAQFGEKWRLPPDDKELAANVEFGAWMRNRAYLPYRSPLARVMRHRGRNPRPILDRVAQRRALRRYRRSLTTSGAPRLAHRASWMETTDGEQR